MTDFDKMMADMDAKRRANYGGLRLAEVVAVLEAADPDAVVPEGFGRARSYRGYYDCIAFEPANDMRIGDMLAEAKAAIGRTFTGYKGGEFKMDEHTPVYIAHYGTCSNDDSDELTVHRMSTMLSSATTELEAEPFTPTGAHDDAVRRIREEIDSLAVRISEVPDYDDNLQEARMFLKDALDCLDIYLG